MNSTNKNKKMRTLVGGAALAAALTLGGGTLVPIVTHAQTAPATSPAATQPATTTPATNQRQANPSQNNPSQSPASGSSSNSQGGPGRGGFGGSGKGGPGGHGGGDLSGTISSISGNVVTIKHDSAVNIVATVTSTTTYNMAGKSLTLADLKTGETVRINEVRNSDGTATITSLEVVLARSGGTLSAISGNTLTVTKSDNSTVKVNVSAATTYQDLGKTISLADLKSGDKVEVAGQTNSDGSLDAQVVTIRHDQLGGVVTAINGNNITVQQTGGPGRDGRGPKANGSTANGSSTTTPTATTTATTKTIVVSGSTTYTSASQSAALSDIKVGDRVEAAGTLSSDGNSVNALQVRIDLPSYHGQVTAVNGSTITVQDRGGTHQIDVTSSTKYLNGTASASLSDIKSGSNIEAQGQLDASGKMTAVQIQLGHPQPQKGH